MSLTPWSLASFVSKRSKVHRLRNKVEPFAALLWALGELYLPTPDPARRPGITPPLYTKHVLIWSCSGLGTAFFPVQNVPLFPNLLKNVPFFPVLF